MVSVPAWNASFNGGFIVGSVTNQESLCGERVTMAKVELSEEEEDMFKGIFQYT
jgi:hypothetical protein